MALEICYISQDRLGHWRRLRPGQPHYVVCGPNEYAAPSTDVSCKTFQYNPSLVPPDAYSRGMGRLIVSNSLRMDARIITCGREP